jgi:AraC-like DNA-binding protein
MAAGFHRRRPVAPLDLFIETLWTNQRDAGLAHAREWNLPTGCADLVIPLDGRRLRRFEASDDAHGRSFAAGVLQGAQLRATLRDTSQPSCVVGVQFKPAGLAGFWREPAQAFAGETLSLDTLWPGFADDLRTRIDANGGAADASVRLQHLELALLQRLRIGARPDPMAAWATARLASGCAVGDVQRATGLAPGTFIARYRAACGMAPKRHAAVMRLQALLRAAPSLAPWAALAADAGYADQAHMNRQFAALAGMTPGHYRRHATAFASHVAAP